jgi:oxygen-independent coproporphyrinogen III oxidase
MVQSRMSDADLIDRYDGRAPRYTSYPTAASFTDKIGPATYAEWLATARDAGPASIYLHVPFCERLCLYCGCNTAVVRSEAARHAYAGRLIKEIGLVATALGARAPAAHVHWGGGTPTTLAPADMIAVMKALRAAFAFDASATISVEIDPTTFAPDRVAALKTIGLTRASLGVQDFDEGVQEAIGRKQSFAETAAAAEAARGLGVTSLNLDLIYGLPRQTVDSVRRTALQALKLGADRIAVFGYAHVPWMKKHQQLIAEADLPGALERFKQQEAIRRVLIDHGGYEPVGLDHFARPTDPLAAAMREGRVRRNFQGYTTDESPLLLGFGASAIGGLPQGFVQNLTAGPAYAKAIDAGRLATARGVAFTTEDRLRGALIERLMCSLSVDLVGVAESQGADPALLLDDARGLARFVADGLARWDGRRVDVTEKGRPFVRSIAALFDATMRGAPAEPRFSRAV